jgi:hypothetical protein
MNKERLVVIGNGMAGARLVADLLSRGGGNRFEIAIFGDDPDRVTVADDLLIRLRPVDGCVAHGVFTILTTPVGSITTASKSPA